MGDEFESMTRRIFGAQVTSDDLTEEERERVWCALADENREPFED